MPLAGSTATLNHKKCNTRHHVFEVYAIILGFTNHYHAIRSENDLYEISYRQPFLRSPREEFALSLRLAFQDGQTFVNENLPQPFGIGADANGNSRTRVIKFGQDYLKRDLQGA